MAKKEFDVTSSEKVRKKKKGKKGKGDKTDLSTLAAKIARRTLREIAYDGMKEYAMEVNLERSVPDLLDGLKPVQRRIAYMAHVENSRGDNIGIKTARLMGAVMGRLHPHAEASDAAETMMHQATPLLTGDGNWGSLIDNAAAARYTHCTLSNYGWSFFDPNYIHKSVTAFVPNYDDTYEEPVCLPALLPNVLFNGTDIGVGVGVTTKIPMFTPESVIPLVVRLFKREKLTEDDFFKGLKFAHKWGGHMVPHKKNKEQLRQLLRSHSGSIEFESDLIVDRDKKRITVKDWAPGVDIIKWREKVLELKQTADVYNVQGLEYVVESRKDYNLNQFDEFVEKVQKLTRTRQAYKVMVTHRTVTEKDGVIDYENKLLACSIPECLMLWCKERLDLELRSLKYRVVKLQKEIDYSKLLIYAADKVDIIVPCLRKPNTKELLMKKLKLSEEQVDQILQLRLQQLTRLDQDALKDKLAKQKKEMKQLEKWQKAPRKKIATDIENMLPLIDKDRKTTRNRKEEKLELA